MCVKQIHRWPAMPGPLRGAGRISATAAMVLVIAMATANTFARADGVAHSFPWQLSLQRIGGGTSAAQGRPAGGGGVGGDIIVFDIVDSVSLAELSEIEGDIVLLGTGSTRHLRRSDRFGRLRPEVLPSGIYLIAIDGFDEPEFGLLWVDESRVIVLGLRYQF